MNYHPAIDFLILVFIVATIAGAIWLYGREVRAQCETQSAPICFSVGK